MEKCQCEMERCYCEVAKGVTGKLLGVDAKKGTCYCDVTKVSLRNEEVSMLHEEVLL